MATVFGKKGNELHSTSAVISSNDSFCPLALKRAKVFEKPFSGISFIAIKFKSARSFNILAAFGFNISTFKVRINKFAKFESKLQIGLRKRFLA